MPGGRHRHRRRDAGLREREDGAPLTGTVGLGVGSSPSSSNGGGCWIVGLNCSAGQVRAGAGRVAGRRARRHHENAIVTGCVRDCVCARRRQISADRPQDDFERLLLRYVLKVQGDRSPADSPAFTMRSDRPSPMRPGSREPWRRRHSA
jgi:hypothetical protein